MNPNYVWPACVAAAAHLALLFGFPKTVRPEPPGGDDRPAILDRDVFRLPPEEIIAVVSAAEATEPDQTRPTAEPVDRPTLDQDRPLPVITPTSFPADPLPMASWPAVPVERPAWAGLPGPGVGGPGIALHGELDRTPRTRFQGAPIYPPEARRDGRSGVVVVEFVVDETGAVTAPRVAHSTDRGFEDAALRAVARWRFEPGRRHGAVVRFRMAVPIHFSLNE